MFSPGLFKFENYGWVRYLGLVGILLFLCYGCINLVMEEFSEFESVPTVNAILVNDSLIEIQISEAVGINTTAVPYVNDAEVLLYKGEVFLEQVPNSENGLYRSSEVASPNAYYNCIINIPKSQTIHCSDSLPEVPEVSIIEQNNTAGLDEEGHYSASIEFTFNADPGTVDFYEIVLLERERRDDYLQNLYPFNEDYDFLLNEGIEPYSTATLLFSDSLLDVKQKTLCLRYRFSHYSTGCYGDSCFQRIDEQVLILEVRRISYDYYRYKKQFYLYEKFRYTDIVEGVVTPLNVFSNIENGTGVFAAYASAVDSIFVEAEEIPL